MTAQGKELSKRQASIERHVRLACAAFCSKRNTPLLPGAFSLRRINTAFSPAAIASAALLAACSGNSLLNAQPAWSGSPAQSPSLALMAQRANGDARKHPDRLRELVVSDGSLGDLVIFDRKYNETGQIPDNGPNGDWVDAAGNAYAANPSSVDVSEYNHSGSLISTYSTGLTDPVDVTTDAKGNVYVANYGTYGATIVEYPQGSNTPSNTCNTGLNNSGAAVDGAGDVFVSGNVGSTKGALLEFKHGLSGCSATTLAASIDFAGGLQLDNRKELVVCDQHVGVDIIPPPYSSISKTITVSGAADYLHDALDASNTTLFIADAGTDEVYVVSFPTGSLMDTLSQGFYEPLGVATYPFEK